MRCPTCEAENAGPSRVKESKHTTRPSHTVIVYDETGEMHVHDAASVRTTFHCTNGHTTTHDSFVRCPVCGVAVDPSTCDPFGRPLA